MDLIAHFVDAARLAIDPAVPGFSDRFHAEDAIQKLIRECYLSAHERFLAWRLKTAPNV
ncbi:MAG: hypothetical protein QM775_27605 [Pirellulales bacterium]